MRSILVSVLWHSEIGMGSEMRWHSNSLISTTCRIPADLQQCAVDIVAGCYLHKTPPARSIPVFNAYPILIVHNAHTNRVMMMMMPINSHKHVPYFNSFVHRVYLLTAATARNGTHCAFHPFHHRSLLIRLFDFRVCHFWRDCVRVWPPRRWLSFEWWTTMCDVIQMNELNWLMPYQTNTLRSQLARTIFLSFIIIYSNAIFKVRFNFGRAKLIMAIVDKEEDATKLIR